MLLDPSVGMFEPAKNADQALAQDHCLTIILVGANKNLCQEATMNIYDESLNAMRRYHKLKLGDIEIEGKKFTPPVKVKLHDKNISRIQQGIVAAYKNLDVPTPLNQAPFAALKNGPFGKFYSIMNDGIQKFSTEFNGVFLRTIDTDFDITNLPWALTQIPGKVVFFTFFFFFSINNKKNYNWTKYNTKHLTAANQKRLTGKGYIKEKNNTETNRYHSKNKIKVSDEAMHKFTVEGCQTFQTFLRKQ